MIPLDSIRAYTLTSLIAYAVFLWLGLYLLARKASARIPRLAGIAMLSLAAYLIGSALIDNASSVPEAILLDRIFWVAPLPGVIWLHTTLELANLRSRRYMVPLVIAYVAAGALIFSGWVGDALIDSQRVFVNPSATPAVAAPPGDWYWLFTTFLIVILAACCVVLWVAVRQTPPGSETRRQRLLILAGTALFSIGGTLLTLDVSLRWMVPESYFQSILLIGALIVGYSIVEYQALMSGTGFKKDFWSTLFAAVALVGTFSVALLYTHAPLWTAVAVVFLVLLETTFHERLRVVWESPFFSDTERDERLRLAERSRDVAEGNDTDRHPSSFSDEDLAVFVLSAVQSIAPPTGLLDSPLLHLRAVTERARTDDHHRRILPQERANALAELLADLIDDLKPSGPLPETSLGDDWGPYCSLRYHVLKARRMSPTGLDARVMEWRKQRQKTYHQVLVEAEKEALRSLVLSIRALDGAPQALAQ